MSGIIIKNRVYDLGTNQYMYDAEFTGIGGHTIRRTLSAKDICNSDYMASLAREYLGNLSIQSVTFRDFTENVQRQVSGKELVYAYSSIGWYLLNGEVVYRSSDVITKDGEKKGLYKGKFDTACVGSYDEYIRMINTHITNCDKWSPLEWILAYASGAILKGFLRIHYGIDFDNFMVQLEGPSAIGKSTAIQLAISLASNPNGNKSMKLPMSSTDNAMLGVIGDSQGVLFAFDETPQSSREFTDLILTLGNGENKARMNGNEVKRSDTFDAMFLSAGNVSLRSKTSKSDAISSRFAEIGTIYYTSSSEQAEAIKECCSKNYGHMVPCMARTLLNNPDKYKEMYDDELKKIKTQMREDEFDFNNADRLAKIVAVINVGGRVLSDSTGLELHLNKIEDFSYREILISRSEFGSIRNLFTSYLSRLVAEGRFEKITSVCIGDMMGGYTKFDSDFYDGYIYPLEYFDEGEYKIIDNQIYNAIVAIPEFKMGELVKRGRFPSVSTVLFEFASKDLLRVHDKQRAKKELKYHKKNPGMSKYYDPKLNTLSSTDCNYFSIYFYDKDFVSGNMEEIRTVLKECKLKGTIDFGDHAVLSSLGVDASKLN